MMFISGEIVDILKMLGEYQIEGAGVVVGVILLYFTGKAGLLSKLFGHMFEKYVDYFIKRKGKSKTVAEVTPSDITNHDIFSFIDFWRYSKIPTFKFSTEYRTVVFRKYLTIMLKAYKDELLRYVNSKSYVNMTDAELWKSLLGLINDTVYAYESEMSNAGIPRVVIEKMKGKNNDWIGLTIDLIENICITQFYRSENNYLKVYSVMNIILSILENTIQNSESVCNTINGELSGQSIHEGGREYREP